ncbi:MAG: hypothetical protein KDC92_06230, partial [Bacteroidetes bacterium]|nr:hypothetical protein [Bacteroidota bacterium]
MKKLSYLIAISVCLSTLHSFGQSYTLNYVVKNFSFTQYFSVDPNHETTYAPIYYYFLKGTSGNGLLTVTSINATNLTFELLQEFGYSRSQVVYHGSVINSGSNKKAQTVFRYQLDTSIKYILKVTTSETPGNGKTNVGVVLSVTGLEYPDLNTAGLHFNGINNKIQERYTAIKEPYFMCQDFEIPHNNNSGITIGFWAKNEFTGSQYDDLCLTY